MRYLTATQLFDGKQLLPQGKVLVLDAASRLLNIANEAEIEPGNIERHEGLLCPGFVNAHCHLELSYLKGEIAEKKGLIEFAKGIMTKRMAFGAEKIKEAAVAADKEMQDNGIVAVGDISNVTDSFAIKKESPVFYHTFIELLGLNPQNADVVFTFGKDVLRTLEAMGLRGSLTPHAPYSVSPELMQRIAALAKESDSPVSIHNQESAEEDQFFKEKKGGFMELYQFLKLPLDFFEPTGRSSLRSYFQNLAGSPRLMLVHDTFTGGKDVAYAEQLHGNLSWCLCPNANLYIENRLPDVDMLRKNARRICIGTDSLASNHQLSIVSEMNVLLRSFPAISIDEVLGWATSNGAEALGLAGRFGSFIPSENAGLNLLSLEGRELKLLAKLA